MVVHFGGIYHNVWLAELPVFLMSAFFAGGVLSASLSPSSLTRVFCGGARLLHRLHACRVGGPAVYFKTFFRLAVLFFVGSALVFFRMLVVFFAGAMLVFFKALM